MASPLLRIGTRGSPLALAQADLVRSGLAAFHSELAQPGALEVVAIRTTGDRITDRPLADFGGKGLFTKEIDEALLEGRVDLAVHSMKDLPTRLPDGIVIAAVLERADARDALISGDAKSLAGLPPGARVGTASLRRQAQILHARPDLSVVTLRGNVETRLKKIEAGAADATLLALAGLERLGLAHAAAAVLSADEMLPAVGQGAIGVTCRANDARARGMAAALDDKASAQRIRAERALLGVLDGSCKTPIAGYAEIGGSGRLRLRALIAKPDGSGLIATARTGAADDAEALGRDAGEELKGRAGPDFFAAG